MPNYKMKPTLNGEGGGQGTTVVANPELVGDEPNLEGLEVGGVKYKVSGVEYVNIQNTEGYIGDGDYQKLINGAYIKFIEPQEAEFNDGEIICLPNHIADELVYSSVVRDGKYYQVKFTVVDRIEFECTYTVIEKSVSGEFIYLTFDTTEIDLETAQKLTGPNKNNYIIALGNNSEESPNIFLRPDGEFVGTWTSNIINGKYWKFRITDWQEAGIFVSITEETVVSTKRTRQLILAGDIQCYPGKIVVEYESEDTTPAYYVNEDSGTNPVLAHLLNELPNRSICIRGYGYIPDTQNYELVHPIELSVDVTGNDIVFDDLSNRGFTGYISGLYGCDVLLGADEIQQEEE